MGKRPGFALVLTRIPPNSSYLLVFLPFWDRALPAAVFAAEL